MEAAYRKPKRTLRRTLALHRVRLAMLQRRLDHAMGLTSMHGRADVDLARERLESAIDEAPTAELEELILAYDDALVSALEQADADRGRRSRTVWQLFMAVLVAAMLLAVLGPLV